MTAMWSHPESHPGDYLRARFLKPLGLSATDLARGCQMSRSRVSDILTGKRAITADTASRLGAFFRMEAETWLALQSAWDLQQAGPCDSIIPLDPPGFLLGPLGATPIPPRPRASPPHLRTTDARDEELARDTEPERRDRTQHHEVRYADGTRALVARRK